MDLKCLTPESIIKLTTSISLLLAEKYNADELEIIKNILCSITSLISTYQNHEKKCYNKNNKKNKQS